MYELSVSAVLAKVTVEVVLAGAVADVYCGDVWYGYWWMYCLYACVAIE